MYCSHCGDKVPKGALYCQNDGVSLVALYDGYQLNRVQGKFCRNCRCENEAINRYCNSCGSSLEEIVEKATHVQDSESMPAQSSNLKRLTNKGVLIRAFVYSVFSIIFSLLLSMIGASVLRHIFRKETTSDLFEIGMSFDYKELISTTDILMLSHMVGIKYITAVFQDYEGTINVQGGLLIFLIIPAIVLVSAGYISGRNSQKSAIERICLAFPIAIMYAVMFGIISLVSGVSLDLTDSYGDYYYLYADFSFAVAFFNSLILSYLFVCMGSLWSLPARFKGPGANLRYGISIQRALITTFTGIIICSVMLAGFMLSQESDDELPFVTKTAMVTQLGGYYWNLSHLNSIATKNGYGEDIFTSSSYSLLGGGKSEDGSTLGSMLIDLLKETWFLLIIPIALHIWAGIQLRKSIAKSPLIELMIYAATIGVLNVILAYLLNFRLYADTGWDVFRLQLSFSFFMAFIMSFVVSFILAYAGMFISGKYIKRSVSV